MAGIYALIWLSVSPLFFTTYVDWKFYPDKNRTLLGLGFTSINSRVEEVVMAAHAISGTLSLLAVIIFTAILIKKLGHKNSWRKTANINQAQAECMSNRDRKTARVIVLIASILIVCYTPSVLLPVTTVCEQEFSMSGKYSNIFIIVWSFAFLLESINSSVNILFFYRMSSKFRDTFRILFYLPTYKEK